MYNKFVLISISLVAVFFSCTKDAATTKDEIPVIQVSSPAYLDGHQTLSTVTQNSSLAVSFFDRQEAAFISITNTKAIVNAPTTGKTGKTFLYTVYNNIYTSITLINQKKILRGRSF